jgi:hypothetical protein
MSAPHGRPEGRSHRSPQGGACLMSPHGRPKGEYPRPAGRRAATGVQT